MSDLDKTQKVSNPALAKTVRIDPEELEREMKGRDDSGRKTVVMQRPPEISAIGWLVGDRGQHRGQMHRIDAAKAVVGVDSLCEVVIKHDHISDRHASIRFKDGAFIITDLDSTNGTSVNGESIHQHPLADGDRVSFGSSEWVFKCVVFQDN
ncbi:MAG: FHA domain-containing protein [Gemmatimonadota bacterium]|nr:FHA domain-containing protein [Gemmatimonadota bacterium]